MAPKFSDLVSIQSTLSRGDLDVQGYKREVILSKFDDTSSMSSDTESGRKVNFCHMLEENLAYNLTGLGGFTSPSQVNTGLELRGGGGKISGTFENLRKVHGE